MTPSSFFTLARIITSGLLFWALARHPYNYYVFLRFAVFAVGAWGFFRAAKEKEGFLVLFHLILAVVFNPFSPVRLEREAWAIIDVIAGLLLLSSIFIIDSDPLYTFLESPTGKKVIAFISIVFGMLLILFGAFLIYVSAKDTISIVKLKVSGRETQARITRVTHRLEDAEDSDGDVGFFDVYETEYTFMTRDGALVTGSARLDDNPISDLSADEFVARYGDSYELDRNSHIPLSVEYEESNPNNNRALNDRTGLVDTIIGGLIIGIFGLWPISSGYRTCKKHALELMGKTKESHQEKRAI